MLTTLVKKPAFWCVVLLASVMCAFGVFRWFGDAFAVLDLDVTMSRAQAIDEARRIADVSDLGRAKLTEAVARFEGDSSTQTFIELEGGGKPALKPLLGNREFTLWHWEVRLYSPGEVREVTVEFTPDGRPSGFFSRVPESEPGAALDVDAARAIAETASTRDWRVDFTRFRSLTASSVTRPGKRIDHEFVYERSAPDTPRIGEGRLRLTMVVAGDRLVELNRYVHVPEAFTRRYRTLRSTNDNIARAAGLVAGVVYGLGGCLLGLIWLMRRHAVRWKPAATWAALVASLVTVASLAAIPGSWFSYDTATSASTHVSTQIFSSVAEGVIAWLLLTVVFGTAEGLGRLAFDAHPQLWRAWKRPAAQSGAIWGRTLAGYAWIGFDLAFITVFYYLVDRYLGWWSPSDALIDPNILGARLPWAAPVSMALQAGMMEESLFRAIPLAGAALLGRRFGRPKLFIVVALVVQAIVFGCAHANYPGQPAYARPVELFIPALVWGIVYLRYGLLPGILFHFGFDLVLMSIPLFVTAVPGTEFDRAIVVGIFALPLLVLIVQRLRGGRFIALPASERNAGAPRAAGVAAPLEASVLAVVDAPHEALESSPAALAERTTRLDVRSAARAVRPWGRREYRWLMVFAVVGIAGLFAGVSMPYDAPGLVVSREAALKIAEDAVQAKGVKLDTTWHRSVRAVGTDHPTATRFLWRSGGRDAYTRLVGTVLPPPHWEVRFARFDGDVAQRETWRVSVVDVEGKPGGVRSIEHSLPESQTGVRLSQADARSIGEKAITERIRIATPALRRVSADATERPARLDWTFVYAEPDVSVPDGGEARITVEVDGDQVVSVDRSLFVPEANIRDQRRRDDRTHIPSILLAVLLVAFAVAIVITTIRQLVGGVASTRAGVVIGSISALAVTGSNILSFNARQFSYSIAEPLDAQMFATFLAWAGNALVAGVFAALFGAVAVRLASRSHRSGPASESWRTTWLAAGAIALLFSGAFSLLRVLTKPGAPNVPPLEAADSALPILSGFVGGMTFLAIAPAAVIASVFLSSRTRRQTWLIGLAGAGVVIAEIASRGDRLLWDRIGGLALLVLVAGAVYRVYIRGRVWMIVPTLGTFAIFGFGNQLWSNAYPGQWLVTSSKVAAIVGCIAIWHRLTERDRPERRATLRV